MDKFTFFLSYYDAARELPEKQRLAFYDAIMQYIFDDVEPTLTGLAGTFWGLTMPYLRKSKAQTENGNKGGRPKGKPNSNPTESQPETQQKTKPKPNGKPSDNPNPNPTESIKKLEVDRDIDTDMEGDIGNPPHTPQGEGGGDPSESSPFDRFWAAYPRKEGKGTARKAWNKIKPGKALVDKILLAVAFAKTSEQWQRENGRYIPHPTTWLNGGRWDDELKPNAGNSTQTPGGKVNTMDVLSRIIAESEGGGQHGKTE